MVRTQIQLTEDQVRWLRDAARENKQSIAEVIRRLIEEKKTGGGLSDRAERRQALRALAGKADSGLTDVATDHDRYLEEGYRS
jgi:hypothetical protein